MMNRLLLQAIEWDHVAAKGGFIPFSKAAPVSLIEQIDDKTIVEIGNETGMKIPQDAVLVMRGTYGVKEWSSILKSRAKASGFNYEEIDDENQTTYIVQHNMGIKWSKYFASLYETSFRELGCDVQIKITSNTISYAIDKAKM